MAGATPFTELEFVRLYSYLWSLHSPVFIKAKFRDKYQQTVHRFIALEYLQNHPEPGETNPRLSLDRSSWNVIETHFDTTWGFCVRATSPIFLSTMFLAWYPFGSKSTIESLRDFLGQGEHEILTLESERIDLRYIVY